jgi:hypothetical protein
MSIYNTTNVKDLPQLEEVISGNFLIIENQFGTNILDFEDFVIGPENASFYNTIVSLSTYSVSMSGTVSSGFSSLTAFTLSAINTKFGALTSNYPRYFEVYPNVITVAAGSKGASTDFNSELSNILINDINIVATNNHAASSLFFASLGQVLNPGDPSGPCPSPYTYTIRISTVNAPFANATFVTKVQKYF